MKEKKSGMQSWHISNQHQMNDPHYIEMTLNEIEKTFNPIHHDIFSN